MVVSPGHTEIDKDEHDVHFALTGTIGVVDLGASQTVSTGGRTFAGSSRPH